MIGFYPDKAIEGRVINCLGENPNEKLLRDCIHFCLFRGYGKYDLSIWLFDWYPTGLQYITDSDKEFLNYSPDYDFLAYLNWKEHSACELYKQVAGYWLHKQLAGRMANRLGYEPEKEDLLSRDAVWKSKGYNSKNLVWLFERFPKFLRNPNDRLALEYSPDIESAVKL